MEVNLPQNCPNFEAWKEKTLEFWETHWPAIKERLADEKLPCNPAPENVFRALCLTPPNAVKVVILGQDPYPQEGRATGLAFSFPANQPAQNSLCEIYAKLFDDCRMLRRDGDLTDWAEQGVLLLNTALTVRRGEERSHLKAGWCPKHPWKLLAIEILKKLFDDFPNTMFVFWGSDAIDVGLKAIDKQVFLGANQPHSRIIASSHPSNQGRDKKVNRTIDGIDKQFDAFSNSHPFRRINQWRDRRGLPAIIWGDPVPAVDARAPPPQ